MSDPNAFGHWKFIHWLFDFMLNPILVQTLQWGIFFAQCLFNLIFEVLKISCRGSVQTLL